MKRRNLIIFLLLTLFPLICLSKNVAIIKNFNDPEIDLISTYIKSMGLNCIEFDKESVTYDSIKNFDLTIWDDIGFQSNGINNAVVATLYQYYTSNKPLYFIGDDLSYSVINLSGEWIENWKKMIHLISKENFDNYNIIKPNSTINHPVLNGYFGKVDSILYNEDIDLSYRTNTGEIILASTNDSPVVLAYENGSAKTVVQNCKTINGGNEYSIKQLEILFKNTIYWLLNQTLGSVNSPDLSVSDSTLNFSNTILTKTIGIIKNVPQDGVTITIATPAGITAIPASFSISKQITPVEITYDGTTVVDDKIKIISNHPAELKNIEIVVFSENSSHFKPNVENLIHQWTFDNGTAMDVVGDADGMLMNGATISDGALNTTNGGYLSLPTSKLNLNTYTALTTEMWFRSKAGSNTGCTMLSYFGNTDADNGVNYLYTAASNWSKSRTAISCGNTSDPWNSENGVDGIQYDDGLLHQMVNSLSNSEITLYIDGVKIGTTPLTNNNSIASIGQQYAYLAKSGYVNDPTWYGEIYNFKLYNKALSEGSIEYLYKNTSINTNSPNVSSKSIQLYPNPVSNSIHIDMEGSYLAEIISLKGKIIYSKELIGPNTIEIKTFPKGIYIVKILSTDQLLERKIIIK